MWAIVVAAGSGARFGGPKQYEVLAGRRVLDWSLAAARTCATGVVLVVPPERAGEPEPAADVVVAGGATRSESVRAGLAAVPDDAEVVVVHDAARPLASPALFRSVVAAVTASPPTGPAATEGGAEAGPASGEGGADGAVPGVPVADTLKRVRAGTVVATVDRDGLVAVQTPQAFRAAALRRAHAAGGEATDDGALVEAAGGRVVVVPGEPANRKLTTRDDLAAAAALLGAR